MPGMSAIITEMKIDLRFRLGLFGLVVLLWFGLYIPHIRTSPGWYGDETIAVDIGRNLLHGEHAFGPLWNTFFTVVYQPIYEGFLSGSLFVSQGDIWGPRVFNALLALGISGILFWGGWGMMSPLTAFSASILFLSASQAVTHFRMAFPHNGVALGIILGLMAAVRSPSRHSDACLGLGNLIAVGSHPMGIYGAIGASFNRIFRPRSWFLVALIPAVVFLGFYLRVWFHFGPWIFEDAMLIVRSQQQYASENSANLLLNIYRFFTVDVFHFLGSIGILMIPLFRKFRRWWPVTAVFFIYSFSLFSSRSNLTIFYYQAVVFLPILAIGTAFLLDAVVNIPHQCGVLSSKSRDVCSIISAAAIAALAVFALPSSLSGSLLPKNQPWVTQSPAEVEAAAEWINSHSRPDDLVIANSNIWWLLKTRVANLLQMTAWDGYPTFMHEFGTRREKFRYSLDNENVRFLVIGDIDHRWTLGQPHVIESMDNRGMPHWPVVWSGQYYLILQNPKFPGIQ